MGLYGLWTAKPFQLTLVGFSDITKTVNWAMKTLIGHEYTLGRTHTPASRWIPAVSELAPDLFPGTPRFYLAALEKMATR